MISHDAPLDLVPDETAANYMDSAEWSPELGDNGFIGLYHQWYASTNGRRELKLYIVCKSSCQLAGIEIKQVINDLPPQTSVLDFAHSEELW